MGDNQDQQYYDEQQYYGQEAAAPSWEAGGDAAVDPNSAPYYQGEETSAQAWEYGAEATNAEWDQQPQEGQWAQQQEGQWAQPQGEGQWTEQEAYPEAQDAYGSGMVQGGDYGAESNPMVEQYRMDDAATKIQGLFRQRQAKAEAQARAEWQYKQVYDAVDRRYKYINRRSGSVHDQRPRLVHAAEDINPMAMRGLIRMQAVIRRKLAKKAVLQRKKQVFSKHYDPDTGMAFYMDKRSGVTTWVKPPGLGRDEVEYTDEDAYLLNKDREIKELKSALDAKDRELATLMHKKTEEVEVMLRRQRIDKARVEGADKRTQEMDLWNVDEVTAWFIEQGLPEYEENLFKNRVDGFLLVHLDDNDWADLGITNRVHTKRLNMLLDPYRIRFRAREAAKKAQEAEKDALHNVVGVADLLAQHVDDLAEDLGPVTPTPRKAADVTLGMTKDDEGLETTSRLGLTSTMGVTLESEDEDGLPPTAEELEELRKDQLNITLETLHPGGAARATKGEVINMHYSCYLEATGQLVESSRMTRHRPFEFVLGLGQVIKGLDRCLGRVGVGSRNKITVRAPYAYGEEGLPPLIPPHAKLIFDVEIISIRTRPQWEKPFIQHPGLSERLYYERPEDESEYDRYIRGLQDAIAELKQVASQEEEQEEEEEEEQGILARETDDAHASVASSVTN